MLKSVLFNLPEQPVVEQPLCPNCGRGMWLYCVERASTPAHLIFSCSECAQHKTVVVKYE
jgi:hypothetical protein